MIFLNCLLKWFWRDVFSHLTGSSVFIHNWELRWCVKAGYFQIYFLVSVVGEVCRNHVVYCKWRTPYGSKRKLQTVTKWHCLVDTETMEIDICRSPAQHQSLTFHQYIVHIMQNKHQNLKTIDFSSFFVPSTCHPMRWDKHLCFVFTLLTCNWVQWGSWLCCRSCLKPTKYVIFM